MDNSTVKFPETMEELNELIKQHSNQPGSVKSGGIFTNPGWQCPRCGKGNSPNNPTCPCVSFKYDVTYRY